MYIVHSSEEVKQESTGKFYSFRNARTVMYHILVAVSCEKSWGGTFVLHRIERKKTHAVQCNYIPKLKSNRFPSFSVDPVLDLDLTNLKYKTAY